MPETNILRCRPFTHIHHVLLGVWPCIGRFQIDDVTQKDIFLEQLVAPLAARTYTLVVPDINTMVIHPGDSAVHGVRVLMCIAHEDIRAVVLPTDEALELLRTGRIVNATTALALQWLALNRERLRGACR